MTYYLSVLGPDDLDFDEDPKPLLGPFAFASLEAAKLAAEQMAPEVAAVDWTVHGDPERPDCLEVLMPGRRVMIQTQEDLGGGGESARYELGSRILPVANDE